jgi:histidinol-phosphatase
MTSGQREEDLAVALELADLADAISLRRFRASDLEVDRKPDGGIVSEVDRDIELAIVDHLADRRPSDAILGEEFGAHGDGERVWMIDPIDGTADYVEGSTAEWATLIALVEADVPVVGVVARPAIGLRRWAAQGCGAFANGQAISVSDTETLADATICDDFRVTIGRGLEWNPLLELSAACAAVHPWTDRDNFLRVADGTVDLLLNWYCGSGPDLTPSICIVQEAGGRFADLNGRADYNADIYLVSNGLLHDEAVAIVTDTIAAGRADPARRPTEDIPAILAARNPTARGAEERDQLR